MNAKVLKSKIANRLKRKLRIRAKKYLVVLHFLVFLYFVQIVI